MANKDVNLVIRAKSQATGTLKDLNEALEAFKSITGEIKGSVSAVDGSLGQLTDELGKLNTQADRLSAFSGVAKQLDNAGASVKRLQRETVESYLSLRQYRAEISKISGATDNLKARAQDVTRALEANKNATKAARAETLKSSVTVKAHAQAQKELDAALSKGTAEQQAKARAAFDQTKVAVDKAVASYEKLAAEQKELVATSKNLKSEIKASERQYNKLSAKARGLSEAVSSGRSALKETRSEMTTLKKSAREAGQAFGGLTLDQKKLGAQSEETAKDIQRVSKTLAALDKFSDGGGNFTNPKQAEAIRRQREELAKATEHWRALQAETKRLAVAMRSTEQPTESQTQAFGRVGRAAKAAKEEFRRQQETLARLQGSSRTTFAAFASGGQHINTLSNNMRGVSNTSSRANAALRQTGGGLKLFEDNSRKAMSVTQRLRGEVLSLATAYVGLYSTISKIGGVINAYRAIEAAQNRLGVVFEQDKNATATELRFLERQAARLGIEFSTLADEYSKFAVASKAANFTNAETRKVFLSVAEAGRVNKLSMEQMQGVFLALTQMISKGKITSEELRRQMGDRLPGAFNIFADALGLSTAALDDMMKRGEVLADSTNLIKFSEELDRRFGSQLAEALKSTTTLIGEFQNELFQSNLRVGEGGFIAQFNELLKVTTARLRSREGRDFFLAIGSALGKMTSVLTFTVENFDTLATIVQVLIAIRAARWFVDLTTRAREAGVGLTTLATSAKTTGTATVGLRGQIAALRAQTASFATTVKASAVSLKSMNISMVAARAGATAMAVSFRGIRVAMVAVRASAAAMWAAVGGPIGLIVAGLTLIASELMVNWIGGIEDSTSALDEHNRLLNSVISGYEALGDKSGDLASGIKDVSLDQLNANVRALRNEYAKVKDEALEVATGGNLFDRLNANMAGSAQAVRDLRNEFRDGKISAADFRAQLEKLYPDATNDNLREFIERQLEAARKAEKLERALGEGAVMAKEFGSTMQGLDKDILRVGVSMGEMADGAEEVADPLEDATEKADNFNAAMAELVDKLPEFESKNTLDDELAEIQAAFDKAAESAVSYQQVVEAARVASEAAAVATDNYAASLQKQGLAAFQQTQAAAGNLLTVAQQYTGYREDNDTQRASLTDLFAEAGFDKVDPKMTAWCAAFVNAVLAKKGLPGTGSLRARSFLDYGTETNTPQVGDIVVLKRGSNPEQGHVGFFNGFDAKGNVKVFGGNQDDGVNTSTYDADRVLSFRRAPTVGDVAQAREQDRVEQEKKLAAEAKKTAEEIAKQHANTQNLISDKEFEIQQAEQIAAGKGREAAIEAAIRDARKQNANLTQEQVAKIAELTGQLYDQQNATNGIKEAEAEVARLQEYRAELTRQIQELTQSGDNAGAEGLRTKLTEVNGELEKAIQSTVALYQKMGGEGADLAILKLQGQARAIKEMGQKAIVSADQIAQMMASGLTNAFDRFARAVANGENAFEALANSFRQFAADFLIQIGKMILQQTILNALQGLFKGIGFGGIGFGSFHTGGVVGQRAPQTRFVSPGVFQNAVRYHTGGLAGLRPNEVPIVAEKNEEILTTSDPRHRFNGGSNGKTQLKVINAIDAGDMVAQGLASKDGEEAFLNFIRNNPGAVRNAMES